MAITMEKLTELSRSTYCTQPKHLTTTQLHLVLGKAIMGEIAENWAKSKKIGRAHV